MSAASPFIFSSPPPVRDQWRLAVLRARAKDENIAVADLLAAPLLPPAARRQIETTAAELAAAVREMRAHGGVDDFLCEYGLSSDEGVALMCLAEALLRIPDATTADLLIGDKLAAGDWRAHIGGSDSVFVNASTWALLLTGRVMQWGGRGGKTVAAAAGKLVCRAGEPVIRRAMVRAMQIMGRQFVLGRDIDEALKRAAEMEKKGARFSYDMLGEAAMTAAEAERYFEQYRRAIDIVGLASTGRGPVRGPGVSVKLSALHPRYEFGKTAALRSLLEKLTALTRAAARHNIHLCVDAEESGRLEPSLDLIEAAATDKALGEWAGFGLAVQGYQKRAAAVLDFLADLSRRAGRRLMVRLVKGAYWDAEIKQAQQLGLSDYPVFTRKAATDVAYLACAKKLLSDRRAFFPQLATHNAHTVAAVFHLAGGGEFELQRLHGMGEVLFDAVSARWPAAGRRVYAPVGGHEELLAYLARRLLENGANSSFVHRLVDEKSPIKSLVADPEKTLTPLAPSFRHGKIPPPREIYLPERLAAAGVDLTDEAALTSLAAAMARAGAERWTAAAMLGNGEQNATGRAVFNPAFRAQVIGEVADADAAQVEQAVNVAAAAYDDWARTAADARAECLRRAARLLEERTAAAMALLVREGGKTVSDALAEVREAADFCRYYAARAEEEFSAPARLPGPVGERNTIQLRGRGVFVCIAPWNFPLAIFIGQIAAALAAGNAVLAKPAEQTSLVAAFAVRLLREAGVPPAVLQLLPGAGDSVGATLVGDGRVDGVAFTGATETARVIAQLLAARRGALLPFIAETGGQNAMIVDSSALPQQATSNIVRSAFYSAGQRCSALRVLFVQEEIADSLTEMLVGAMDELTVGDPALLETDIGPVIDAEARAVLAQHSARMEKTAKPLAAALLDKETAGRGFFFAPRMFEISSMAQLRREVFGPILHLVRWRGGELDQVISQINAAGYGLTAGVHSRVDSVAEYVRARVRVGNLYVNRDMVGAVVGAQPFGGEGLSGTGPKAGGARYLHRFAVERAVSVDTAAAGGDAALMALDDRPSKPADEE